MPSVGAVELLVLVAVVLGLIVVLVLRRRVASGGRLRRPSPPDRMPQAWLEQHATADPTTDRFEA